MKALLRFFGRLRARRLRAQGLPSAAQAVAGLLPAAQALPPLRLSLREAAALAAPEGSAEFWSAPLGAAIIRNPAARPARLLRLAALPRERSPLTVLDLRAFGGRVADAPRSFALARPLPAHAAASAPLVLRTRSPLRPQGELSAARPASLGLDEAGRLASERDVPALATERPAPPAPGRTLRVRTPLARAPLSHVDVRAYRIDPRSAAFANEGILEPPRGQPAVWLQPWFRGRYVYLPWMARPRHYGLGPGRSELFALWWEQLTDKRPGAKDPDFWRQPNEIGWMMHENCKEQMLIRRDCVKDEAGPEQGGLAGGGGTPAIFSRFSLEDEDFKPPLEFVERFAMPPGGAELPQHAAEAYLQWRTLVNGLEER